MWNESLYARDRRISLRQAGCGQCRDRGGRAAGWRHFQRDQWRGALLPPGVRAPVGTPFAVGRTLRRHLQAAPGADEAGTPHPLSGPTNEFKDNALDFQYQYIGEQHICSRWPGTRIKEDMTLNASYGTGSDNLTDDLTTSRCRRNLLLPAQVRRHARLVLHDREPRRRPVSRSGDPPGVVTQRQRYAGHQGLVGGARLHALAQYSPVAAGHAVHRSSTARGNNYDGYGRNAGDNDTLYFLVWFNY